MHPALGVEEAIYAALVSRLRIGVFAYTLFELGWSCPLEYACNCSFQELEERWESFEHRLFVCSLLLKWYHNSYTAM